MWQSRTSNIPISLNALNTFKQYSRLIHFCHTPLLFLPAWRLQSAATRDHSLTPPQSSHFGLNGIEQSSQAMQSKQEATNAIMIKWHQELCKSMLSEYRQYLQILGFNPIQVESLHKTFVRIRLLDFDLTNTRIFFYKCITFLLQKRGVRSATVLLSQEIDAGRHFAVRSSLVTAIFYREVAYY